MCLLASGCTLLVSDLPLAGGVWNLEAIEDADGQVILRPNADWTYQVAFTDDGGVSAQNACNDCSGQYEDSGSSLTISISCTESACGTPPPYLGYGSALNGAVGYEIERRELRIRFLDREGFEQTLVHIRNDRRRYPSRPR